MQDQVVNQTEYRFESSVFVSFTTWLYITPPPKKKKKNREKKMYKENSIKIESLKELPIKRLKNQKNTRGQKGGKKVTDTRGEDPAGH